MLNERIRELMEQCETKYSTSYEPSYDMEKFAELIIKECVGIIDNKWTNAKVPVNDMEAAFIAAALTFSKDIKEHFGVE